MKRIIGFFPVVRTKKIRNKLSRNVFSLRVTNQCQPTVRLKSITFFFFFVNNCFFAAAVVIDFNPFFDSGFFKLIIRHESVIRLKCSQLPSLTHFKWRPFEWMDCVWVMFDLFCLLCHLNAHIKRLRSNRFTNKSMPGPEPSIICQLERFKRKKEQIVSESQFNSELHHYVLGYTAWNRSGYPMNKTQ